MQDLSREFLMKLVPVVVGLIVTFMKTIKFVQEGENGIRLRFGRAVRDRAGNPVVIPPGFVLMIPFIDTLKRHHVRQQTLRLSDQRVMIAKGLIFNVSAVVMFRVTDIYRALFEINDLDRSLGDLTMGLLRDELAGKNHADLIHIEDISKGLLDKLKEKAGEWGVEFIQFKLTDCAPTSATEQLLNAQIGVELKVKALEGAATTMKTSVAALDPALAAALIGVPMVTSLTATVTKRTAPTSNGTQEEKPGFVERLLT